jgi:glycosyltransferase involved in cell wall biosynthesis
MKISLCTTSMNRLSFLQETLPQNIADNEDYDDLEFVILNYNSKDDIDTWVYDEFLDLIKIGRLTYIKESTASYFRPAHARNVCARMASGDVICNVDADNFTNKGFASFLSSIFKKINIPLIANSDDADSSHGRIALEKRHFMRLGGYDESFLGWGMEDSDLNLRCSILNFQQFIIPPKYLGYIDHDDSVRLEHIDLSAFNNPKDKKVSNNINLEKSRSKSSKRWFVANFNKNWGKAKIFKNYTEEIELNNPWILDVI